LHPFYEKFQNLYQRKLWHQLTEALFAFFEDENSRPYRLEIFTSFVRDFESKLNQLSLVEMAVIVSKEIDNPQTHLEFLSSLLERVSQQQATALLLATLAHAKLLYGDMSGTKAEIDKCSKLLDTMDSVEPNVHAAFYNVAADYYKVKPAYGPYYRHALLYLACLPDLDSTPPPLTGEEKLGRAHDLALAALLGEEIYNFGELLMHPILSSLDGTPHEWIKKLLFTFNEGSIGRFESLVPHFPKEPLLQENYTFLRQKICLMALIELVSQRMGSSSESKLFTFQTIAEETRLPSEEVEHLIMKALSLKLIRGTLDEVSSTATINWVQPRVLSHSQIGVLAKRLTEWCAKLNDVEKYVGEATPELFANA